MLEQAVLVRRRFDAKAGNESADRQIVQLRHDGQCPTERNQRRRDLAHVGQRLHAHDAADRIDLENIVQFEADIMVRLLVVANAQ